MHETHAPDLGRIHFLVVACKHKTDSMCLWISVFVLLAISVIRSLHTHMEAWEGKEISSAHQNVLYFDTEIGAFSSILALCLFWRPVGTFGLFICLFLLISRATFFFYMKCRNPCPLWGLLKKSLIFWYERKQCIFVMFDEWTVW